MFLIFPNGKNLGFKFKKYYFVSLLLTDGNNFALKYKSIMK